ncbi:MAG: secretion system protein Por [Flavobacterium sp. BFFFF1]|uniref:CotH kinase family protein n=1 Tax=Flavobacterium sp. BFFFF1 TaxID=2015557 RepID=UPI000BD9ECFC|nr:CotH kinase family protein [Flavobacterium sp. BFFFF1]OYU81027.1 MAG: secretion system protein Por [Flavobacterium sp. BFFFF1]
MERSFSPYRFLWRSILLVLLAFQHQAFAQPFTDSNLPIAIINTDNNQEIPDDPRIFGNMKIIYRGEGLQNYVTDQNTPAFLNYNGRIDIEIRGSSSQDLPKKQYGFSTKMSDNVTNNNVSLLGMPAENDWILNSLAFDPSLIRDYLSYNIARSLGNYATRTAYCEVVINGQYKGLYILQEKVKADSRRVDITKINNTQNTLPNLSGGYITKCDKTTGGDPVAWTMPNYNGWGTDFIHELPKPEDVTTQQNNYIFNYFNNFQNSVTNTAVTTGYPSMIDIPSFIDFILSNELGSNADGYQLSTYFHKDRNGKLRAGPIWDFNLTYGNDLFIYGFDRSHFDVWQFSDGGNDGAKFWTDLFNDPTFKCYLSKRWHEVTQPGQPMNLTTINNFIDNTLSYISAAAVRENNQWGTIPDLDTEILTMKFWINQRVTWMTNHIGSYSDCSNVAVPALVINKINYNPNTNGTFTNSNDQEFIEIKNAGTTTVNLNGIYFKGTGFVYQFPANQTLSANASVYIASKSAVFTSRYGFAPYGEFTRNLSNNNQDLVLADAFGNVIDQVHYYDSAPWPNADGNGSFLQLTNTALDNSLASSWTAVSMATLGLEAHEELAIAVFPNPAHDVLAVNSGEVLSAIEIYDLGGRRVQSFKPNTNTVTIDTSLLSNGLYVLKLLSGNKTKIQKFTKQ